MIVAKFNKFSQPTKLGLVGLAELFVSHHHFCLSVHQIALFLFQKHIFQILNQAYPPQATPVHEFDTGCPAYLPRPLKKKLHPNLN